MGGRGFGRAVVTRGEGGIDRAVVTRREGGLVEQWCPGGYINRAERVLKVRPSQLRDCPFYTAKSLRNFALQSCFEIQHRISARRTTLASYPS